MSAARSTDGRDELRGEGTLAEVLDGLAGWHLATADALELAEELPDGCAHAVWIDPPYCSGGYTETARRQARGMLTHGSVKKLGWFINDNMGSAGLVWLLRCVAVQAFRVLVEGGSLGVFCDWKMIPLLAPALESSGLRWQAMVIWDKEQPGLGTGFRAQHEVVLHFVKGTGVFHDARTGNVLRQARIPTPDRNHQTAKPPDLIERCLSVVAPPGGLVVDFFTGGGSTGVAARRLGMRFVGCEIDPGIAAHAREAIKSQCTDARRLVKANQLGLFGE
ncbi:DNA-methyltransferase [Polyangium jinanense]|uniref:Methyltransferase n=1 Tax=Polyangium jinanense TaxID=2829994 RepID=A0A9X3X2Q6_9BACT|nr:site-specific DNA-methyltransferase [Polyangium jinanense]MDC3983127.1 site-specific DNA-methyltransferase [Polyangium jinanense]